MTDGKKKIQKICLDSHHPDKIAIFNFTHLCFSHMPLLFFNIFINTHTVLYSTFYSSKCFSF